MTSARESWDRLGGIIPIVGSELVPMAEADIAAIEDQLGVRLPASYRNFLGTYGACSFALGVMIEPVVPLPPPISGTGMGGFSHFYGARSPRYGETLSLAWNLLAYRDRMPETLIPIAADGGGDQICLGIQGAEQEQVFYWDHHNEWDEASYHEDGLPVPSDLKFQNVHLIARSFDDFLERLHPEDED